MDALKSSTRAKALAATLFAAAALALLPAVALADEPALDAQDDREIIDTVVIENATLDFKAGDELVFTGTVPEGAPYSIWYEQWTYEKSESWYSGEDYWYGYRFITEDPGLYGVHVAASDRYAFSHDLTVVVNGIEFHPQELYWSDEDPLTPYFKIHPYNPDIVNIGGLIAAPHRVERLAGATALETTQAIAQKGWEPGDTDTVILATMNGFYDALAAAPLAGMHQAPILLTRKSELSDQALAEIERLQVDDVIIVGGPAAVSDDAQQELVDKGYNVRRIYGPKAVDTAAAIAGEVAGETGVPTCIVATSKSYHDALAIAPLAWRYHCPVFLTDMQGGLPDSVLAAIKESGCDGVIVMGGTNAVPQATEDLLKSELDLVYFERIAGDTAFETAVEAAVFSIDEAGMGVQGVGLATGGGYHDALTGAALCGKNNAVMVLLPKNGAESPNYAGIDFLEQATSRLDWAYVFGGPVAVSEETEAKAEAAVRAPLR